MILDQFSGSTLGLLTRGELPSILVQVDDQEAVARWRRLIGQLEIGIVDTPVVRLTCIVPPSGRPSAFPVVELDVGRPVVGLDNSPDVGAPVGGGEAVIARLRPDSVADLKRGGGQLEVFRPNMPAVVPVAAAKVPTTVPIVEANGN